MGHHHKENFFSKKNVDAIQDYIQFKVFKETKRKIGRQSDMEDYGTKNFLSR